MQFDGYLVKINGEIFPNAYIQFGSYNATPNQFQDMDSYRDAEGILHRNVLAHKSTKIEFSTKYLHLADKVSIQQFLKARVRITVEYWNDEDSEYQTGDFYIPDITYTIYRITENDIMYNPIRIALIEY